MPVGFCDQCNGAKYGEIDHCDCRYRSVVLWPDEVSTGKIPNESTDEHRSREAAEYVCKRLEREGLGLRGEIFPIRTRVERITE